jgi:hypothetical protein
MTQKLLPEPPRTVAAENPSLFRWLVMLYKRVTEEIQLVWSQIDKTGSSIADFETLDHDLLAGLTDDDHTQYHNDTRGDARYYTQTQLDNGQLDTRYYTESEVNSLISGHIESTDVTYENLAANGDVGTGADQVAQGDHLHTGVYEPADATILKDADIGVTVMAYSASNALTTDITYENLSTNGDIGTGATQVAQGDHTHTSLGATTFTGDISVEANSADITADSSGAAATITADGHTGFNANFIMAENGSTVGVLVYTASTDDVSLYNYHGASVNSRIDLTDSGEVNISTGTLQQGGVGVTVSDGTTGGTGSAGAGNQYVELVIGGTTYKVLHDGTV